MTSPTGQHFARAYGLPESMIKNNSQEQRIINAEPLLFEDGEKLEGYISAWAWRQKEDLVQVMSGQTERQQASPELRRAIYRYLHG